MIDDFADFIFELNQKARELLEHATELDEELDKKPSTSDPDRLARIQKHMDSLCSAMTKVVEILELPSSPLDRFFKRTHGVLMLPDVADSLRHFLRAHEQQLHGMGVSERATEKFKALLEEQAYGSMDDPVRVDQVTKDEGGKDVGILVDLKKLQDLVCDCAKVVGQVANIGKLNLLKPCVKGVMGAAAVVIDITGLFTVPDVTGWVLFKAAKSTWVGGKLVKNAIGSISEALQVFSSDDGHKKSRPDPETRNRFKL
jgi:hypothetical protein